MNGYDVPAIAKLEKFELGPFQLIYLIKVVHFYSALDNPVFQIIQSPIIPTLFYQVLKIHRKSLELSLQWRGETTIAGIGGTC